jgi:glycosyltransferase involved in cell wall biosynthesis
MFKLAYSGFPHTGGTHTVYQRLKEGLTPYDIELRWVGLVNSGFQLKDEFKNEEQFGDLLYLEPDDSKKSGIKFVKHIENNFNGVIINVLANPIQTNAARYIQNHILKLQLVHSITPATYRAARAIRDYVHATVGPSPRINNDLVNKMNFLPNQVHNIPHAVNLSLFTQVCSERSKDSPLKLIYLGRIEESSKGILWLPNILQECLNIGINVSLTVAGDGPDLSKLKLKIEQMGLEKYTSFYGRASSVDVPKLFADHHIFIMPSRYEGFCFSLIESMASGCVPVGSRISGVTDFIVSHGKNGFLFDIGNVKEAANFINQLRDKKLWQDFSHNARLTSQSRFSSKEQAQSYVSLIENLRQSPTKIAQPLSLDCWQFPSGLKPSISVYIPDNVKNILRFCQERLAAKAR